MTTDADIDAMLEELEPLLPMAVPVLRAYVLELRAGLEAMKKVERIRSQQMGLDEFGNCPGDPYYEVLYEVMRKA